jgi:hypothetical protein
MIAMAYKLDPRNYPVSRSGTGRMICPVSIAGSCRMSPYFKNYIEQGMKTTRDVAAIREVRLY